MLKPKVCILRTAGTNCDKETACAFSKAGASPELIHINKFISKEAALKDYHILALPGGFTYGDDIAAGRILANELRYKLGDSLLEFISSGKLIIGICNGFQALVKSGLLPGGDSLKQEASLIINDSGKFEDRWVYLKVQDSKIRNQKCAWIKGLPEVIYLPVAHGEGKWTADREVLRSIEKNGQIAFQYSDSAGAVSNIYPENPNGSSMAIAGITDRTGRILGLMPHPERHISSQQHPRWSKGGLRQRGAGWQIFKNGVDYIKEK